jgi:hypothetical protein
VPAFWITLRKEETEIREFVEDWRFEGTGIGVVVWHGLKKGTGGATAAAPAVPPPSPRQ